MSAMRISTKGRYAVRVMLDLAVNNTGEYIKVKQIADRQGISEKYLEQIIAILNKAGFVKSTMGRTGRLSPGKGSGRIYSGTNPPSDGRLSESGAMPGQLRRDSRLPAL